MTTDRGKPGRVVIIADQLLVADVVVIALGSHGFDATSVDLAKAGPLATVLSRVLDDPPHVLLLDVDLSAQPEGRLYLAPMVRAGVEVVMMTSDHEEALRALEAGVRRLIPRTSPLAELVQTLESLVPGEQLTPAPA